MVNTKEPNHPWRIRYRLAETEIVIDLNSFLRLDKIQLKTIGNEDGFQFFKRALGKKKRLSSLST